MKKTLVLNESYNRLLLPSPKRGRNHSYFENRNSRARGDDPGTLCTASEFFAGYPESPTHPSHGTSRRDPCVGPETANRMSMNQVYKALLLIFGASGSLIQGVFPNAKPQTLLKGYWALWAPVNPKQGCQERGPLASGQVLLQSPSMNQ